ncbi:MAG: hypothetical protein Q9197_000184 [Variospora fuerteventurae]
MPLLFKAPNAVPLLHPIFSNIARPRLSFPISGAAAPTTSPSRYAAPLNRKPGLTLAPRFRFEAEDMCDLVDHPTLIVSHWG